MTLPDANLTFLGKLHPAIYHVLYQIVQQGIGTTTPEPQPSYNPYLTDPRTAKGNTYTRDFPTLNHLLDHKEEGFQQRTKKTKQTKRNHVLPRQPSPQTDSTDDEKENQTTLNTRFEYMTPRALSDPNIPDSFHVFWNLKAKDAQKRTRFPAPRFSPSIEHAEKELSFPDIAEREFLAYARAYHALAQRTTIGDYVKTRKLKIELKNSMEALQLKGKKDQIQALKTHSPILATHQIEELNSQTITHFFDKARTYTLRNGIEWNSFFAFTIHPQAVGNTIYQKILVSLAAHPTLENLAMKISTYIEHLMKRLIPVQESYSNKLTEFINRHRYQLTAAIPSADYLKLHLETHAATLAYLHPRYHELRNTPTGVSPEDLDRLAKTISLELLYNVLENTEWKAKLQKTYIATKYNNIHDVPKQKLINDLASLLEAEKLTRYTNAAPIAEMAENENDEEEETDSEASAKEGEYPEETQETPPTTPKEHIINQEAKEAGSKTFPCPMCNKRFKEALDALNHIRDIHVSETTPTVGQINQQELPPSWKPPTWQPPPW